MVQLKDGVGAIVRDGLFGGLSVAEAFVATMVPPAYHHEINKTALKVAFSQKQENIIEKQLSICKPAFLSSSRKQHHFFSILAFSPVSSFTPNCALLSIL